jgi:GNAT superfamily N-acetyltransferase
MATTIRQANVTDSAQVIMLASWWPVESRIVPRDHSGDIEPDAPIRWLGDPGWCILVAVDDESDAMIGYAVGYHIARFRVACGFDVSTNADPAKGVAHLEELHVVPDYERRGIGTLLLSAFERWARQTGCVEINLAGGPAPGFYEKLGYRRRGPVFSFVKIISAT